MDNTTLTSVKILEALYNKFKTTTVNTEMTLQKLTNRTIHLYCSDNEFKNKIDGMDELTVSGSNL